MFFGNNSPTLAIWRAGKVTLGNGLRSSSCISFAMNEDELMSALRLIVVDTRTLNMIFVKKTALV